MVGHVYQTHGFERAGLDEGCGVVGAGGGHVAGEVGDVEHDPGALGVAVAGEEGAVAGDGYVDRGGAGVEVVPDFVMGFEIGAGDPGGGGVVAGVIELIPTDRAVGGPEFVAPYFVDHGAGVNFLQIASVEVDRPDAIVVLPGAFVAIHQDIGIGGGAEEMIVPVIAGVEGF